MRHVTPSEHQPPLVASRTRLTPTQIQRLREIARSVLVDQFGGIARRMAPALEMSQPNLSRFLARQQGIAEPNARKLLELAGLEPDAVGLGEGLPVARRPGTLSSLPSWGEAESVARRLYPHLPDEVWEEARKFSTAGMSAVTPDVVLHLALAVAASKASPERKAS